MKNLKWIPLTATLFLLVSCNMCNRSKSREKPDVSNIKADGTLMRFDKDLFEQGKGDYSQTAAAMQSRYDGFFDFYMSQFVVGPHPVGDTTNVNAEALQKFLHDGYINRLQDSINKYFADSKDVEGDLTMAFKYLTYYFPEITTPKVVTINSGFSLGAFTYGKDVLGLGLDLYLGGNNPDYDSAGIYQYVKHKMRREYIARNSVEVLYNLYFGQQELSHGKTLIEAMTEKGKKLYLLSYVLPDAPDSLLVGFTQKQTLWCEDNEYEIWKFLNEKDLLYKDNYMDQKRYLDEGPTTPGMPQEAPGNIGGWIGLQIVRKFMKETGGKVTLHDMIIKYDAKTIVEKAKYRPAKGVF